MKAYKLKWVSIVKDKNGSNILQIRLVERFIDWKYDKFISINEAMYIIDKAVIYEKDFDSIMSKAELKRKSQYDT